MDPATASELERHDKLKEKYTQLKQSYNVLKKGLLDKQEECGRLDQQVKEKETRLRQQLEEIDKLQYQNGRMSKQMGTLNSQVEELKQRSQQSSWSVGGLISGKPQQEAMQKAEEEIRVLRDHMETQIQQNEELHMKIFAQDEELQRLREERTGTAQELDERSSLLEKERQYCGRLKAELREASERGHLLEEELSGSRAALEALQATLDAERREARRYSSGLEAKLARWLPFHEAAHEAWNQWNVAPRCGRELHRRSQALQRLHAAAGEACAAGGALLQLWSRTLAAPSGLAQGQGQGQGQGQRTQTLTKLADAAQQLSAALRETAPELMGALGPRLRQPRPSAQHLRKSSSALLQAHRSWVLHQSLLLLHDAPSSPGERQKAERLVDSLWHVHRCVRTLLAKLRMLRCVPDIVAQSTSSSHFSLARRALRRGDSAERMQNLGEVPERLLARVAVVLGDAAAAWEGLGRSLSTWAGAQESGSMAELLESLHQFHACLVGRVMPALDQVAADVPQSIGVLAQRSCLDWAEGCGVDSAHSGYLHRAAMRLRQACPGIGFDESQQTLLLARRLVAEGSRAKGELRQQVERLQVVTDEKVSLAEELRVLQDRHELLRSNFQVLEQQGAAAAATPLSTNAATAGGGVRPEATSLPATASTSAGLIPNQAVAPPGPGATAGAGAGAAAGGALLLGAGDLLLSSRQRALLESLSVTAQESSALRQHGFFVDVISLSAGEVGLAGGSPDPAEASEPWELAVRKVYEQHCRGLQAQVRAADGRAVELQLSVQRCADLRRQQEEARRQLQDEVKAGHAQLEGVREDMATTRKNYDQQLAMLTEHICTLSVRLSEKDAGLASLQSQKILCGHCGTWNTMGRLMGRDGNGSCKTCKEKVLSEATG